MTERTRRVLKAGGIAAIVLLLAAQLVRPARINPPVPESRSLEAVARITPAVSAVLERACRDCHSNRTVWPWYSNVAPVSWFVIDHVNHARSHLNFSTWADYEPRRAGKLLRSMCGETKNGYMPLPSYLLVHRHARLTSDDIAALCAWSSVEFAKLNLPMERQGR